jgi:hypothetical protein
MTLAKTAGSNPEFNNTEQTTEMKGSMETQIPFFKPMVMPTTAQMAQVLGQKFDENIVAPVQMIAEEIAMNLRVAKGLGAGIAKTAAGLAVAATVMSCDPTEVAPKEQINTKPTEAQLLQWHQEAEAEADRQGWSQGVKSLAAGVIDYYYYKESANGPLLIRLSYQVDAADFIAKIEADAANRKTYDPKTEGVFQANVASLEGDNKNTAWFVPSSAIYEAKAQGKTKLELVIGEYAPPVAGFNTIGKNEGVIPNKQMQIYSGYGIKNATKVEDRIKDTEKRGQLKDIL